MAVMSTDATGAQADADLARLVRAAQRGDQLAMAELIDLLTPFVARLCGPIALQHGADAAQESLIAIFRGLRGLREPAALFGWVRAIAVREAVRVALRERQRSGEPFLDLPARSDPLLAVDIRDTLARLSPEHRAVLVLRDLEGLDEQTASRLLAVAPGTVKSRLARARASFRRAWER
jgi:DNA-directed RNA polymerase specialized sigma24 family protein